MQKKLNMAVATGREGQTDTQRGREREREGGREREREGEMADAGEKNMTGCDERGWRPSAPRRSSCTHSPGKLHHVSIGVPCP